ncbi:hypothetical protein [Kitasatospora sp. NPDC054795]
MTAGDQVTVPAQYGVGPHQQPHPTQHLRRQSLQQRGQDCPVACYEADPLAAQLPLQNADLMAQSQDLHVLLTVAHRQQPQQRERVRHTQVRQS